jgi:tetratricopeptide (TPR) repeat protein
MNKKVFWLSIVAVLASFAGGFLIANSLNRNEINALRAENETLKNAQNETNQTEEELSLSDEEIKRKIIEADQNPTNFSFQKNLGLALYNYASMKQNAELLADVSRLLNRVYENNPKDYDTVVTLGNINLDIGYFAKNNENFQKARVFYEKALEQKPNDENVRTDLGLTYFLSNPPDTVRAIVEFQKSLLQNPKDERALQFMIKALLSQNKKDEAGKYMARLKEVNPDNQIFSKGNPLPVQDENNLQNQ